MPLQALRCVVGSHLVNSAFSELYHASGAGNGYDNLSQLTAFERGVLSASQQGGPLDTVASPSHSQSWVYDALGNWSSVTTDGVQQTRTANQENEITSISGQTTQGYDANGNTTTDQAGNTLVYDAWDRLVAYKNGTTTLTTYGYDALGRRITENPGTLRDLYYSSAWQVLEERVGTDVQDQEVWSAVYVDALVERDRDPTGGGTLTERLYPQQDATWNVTAVVSTSAAVQERYDYDPYGEVTYLTAGWSVIGSSTVVWVYLHQGARRDSATGMDDSRNRIYDAALGRWLQQDPLGFLAGDSNFYRYLGDSPVTWLDPKGLSTTAVSAGDVTFNIRFSCCGPLDRARIADALLQAYRAIDRAHDDVYELLDNSLFPRKKPQDVLGQISHWFGGPKGQGVSRKQLEQIESTLWYMKEAFKKDIVIDCTGKKCKPNWYAHTQRGYNGAPIILCAGFFALPFREQIGVLLHEMSHCYGNTDDHGYLVGRPILPNGIPEYEDEDGKPVSPPLGVPELITNAGTFEEFLVEYYILLNHIGY